MREQVHGEEGEVVERIDPAQLGRELERVEGDCLIALLQHVAQVQVAVALANGCLRAGAFCQCVSSRASSSPSQRRTPGQPGAATAGAPARRRSRRRGRRTMPRMGRRRGEAAVRPRGRRVAMQRGEPDGERVDLRRPQACRRRGARSRTHRRRTGASARRPRPRARFAVEARPAAALGAPRPRRDRGRARSGG